MMLFVPGMGVSSAARRLFALLLSALLVLPSPAFVFAQGRGGAAVEEAQPVTIIRIRGEAQVLVAGTSRWRGPHEREQLPAGSRLKTGAGANVILELSDRNIIAVGESTELAIDASFVRRESTGRGILRNVREVQRVELNLPRGEVTSVLRNLDQGSRYHIRTPVATAGVRGTIFHTRVRGNEASEDDPSVRGTERGDGNEGGGLVTVDFTCLEGSLDVTTPGGGRVDVFAGFSLTLSGAPVGDGGGPPDDGPGGGNGGQNDNAGGGNTGTGNQGQGVGNTGPGNQGQGPNEGAGNAGGTPTPVEIPTTLPGGVDVVLVPTSDASAALLSDLQASGILVEVSFTAPRTGGGAGGGICGP